MNDDIFNQLPQKPIQDHLSDVPSLEEVEKAINQLKNNKATGSDGVPAKLFKVGGPALTDHTHRLIPKIWSTKTIPTDLRDISIVTIFKKGDKAQCGNYRGISLLLTAGKIC